MSRELTARTIALWGALLATMVTGLTWKAEHDSCVRQGAVRVASRIFADTAYNARTAAAALDLRRHDIAQYRVDHEAALAYQRSSLVARPLTCNKLLPDSR